MAQRQASAVWNGGLKGGNGTFRIPRGNMEGPYTFASRFEEGQGLSPEDLLAAAHAACFSMAFSAGLEKAGFTPDTVATNATVTLETVDGAPTISNVLLEVTASVPGIQEAAFQQQATDAGKNCPVSRLFEGADITVNARLEP